MTLNKMIGELEFRLNVESDNLASGGDTGA